MAKQAVKLPGEVLRQSFLDEYGLSPAKVAENTGLSLSAIRQIIQGRMKISLTTAVRFAAYFGNTYQYWVELQTQYDLTELQKDTAFVEAIKKIPKARKGVPAKKAEPKKADAKKAVPNASAAQNPKAKKQPKPDK